jgi:iron complex outermembrane recepter protein
MKRLLSALVGATLVLTGIVGSAAEADRDVLRLSIERKSLRDALNDWAQQTGYQLIAEINGEFTAPAVEGRLTAQEALERLLAGTPLTYQWMSERLVAVKEKRTSPASLQATSAEVKERTASDVARTSGDERRVQLAVTESRSGQDDEGSRNEQTPRDASEVEELEQIVVTGTHIRGTEAVGSKIITISRDEIDASGYATVQDLLKTIPENVGASFTELLGDTGNFLGGTGINLRGLGAGATLTLVNGRRLSGSGDFGDFVDIDSIPVAAIERVEILPDGASAIYGSDAIAGVVNILLRRDYEGAETRVRYASANGSPEKQVSQVVGTSWKQGGGLIGAQYYKRNALAVAKRPYMRADKTPFGGTDYRSPFSNPANVTSSDFSMYVGIPRGQDGTSLTPDSFLAEPNFSDQTRQTDALPQNETQSVFASLHHRVRDGLELSFDGRYSERDYASRDQARFDFLVVPATNPFYVDPAGGTTDPVYVDYSFLDDLGPSVQTGTTKSSMLTGQVTWQTGRDWRLVGAQSYARETYDFRNDNQIDAAALAIALADPDPATAFNPFADGSNTNPATLESIRTAELSAGTTQTLETTAILDGPLFSLPGGPAKMSVGMGYRRDALESNLATGHEYVRNIGSGFLELLMPFISAENATAGLRRLELSAAVRYDDYNDFGDTTNPRFGVLYAPSSALALRGSWGTSFVAPRLTDLDVQFLSNGGLNGFLTSLPDPSSPSGDATAFVLTGNNPDLKPETATTWTVGLDLTPPAIPGLAAQISYYSIDYENRIATPGPGGSFFSILFQPDVWADFITRAPTLEQLDAACQAVQASACPAAPPDAIVDVRLRNVSERNQRGIDSSIQQRMNFTNSTGLLWAGGTYVLANEERATKFAAPVDLVDTILNPAELRLRAGGSWSWQAWTTNLTVNYIGGYENNLTGGDIDSWTTVDAGLEFRVGEAVTGFRSGMSAALRATNVLDEDPPFANIIAGFDPMNANPLGRLVSISISKAW